MKARTFSSVRHHFADSVLWYVLSMGTNFVARFVSIGVLWRSIADSTQSQQHYAWLSVGSALVMLLSDFGIENGAIRFFAEGPRYYTVLMERLRKSLLWIAIPSVLLLSAGWYFVFGTLDGAAAALAGVGFALFQIAAAFFRSTSHVHRYAAWNTTRNAIITLSVVLLYNPFQVLSVGVWFLVYGVVSVVAALVMFARVRPKTAAAPNPQERAEVKKYLAPIFFCGIILWMQGFVDKGFLFLYHKPLLGSFQLLLDYTLFFGMIALLVNRAWPTVFFALARTRVAQGSRSGSHLVTAHIGAFVASALVVLIGPHAMQILSGSPFSAQYRVSALALMLFAETLGIYIAVVRPTFEFSGNTSLLLWSAAVAVVVNVLGNAVLIPAFALAGAAGATAISMLVLFWILFFNHPHFEGKERCALSCLAIQMVSLLVLCLCSRLVW